MTGKRRSADAVVLTFDDGTADFCDLVVPALVDAGVPATLYAATHFIDTGTEFPWGAPPASWAGLRDAASPPGWSRSARTPTPTPCSTGPIPPRSAPSSTARSS